MPIARIHLGYFGIQRPIASAKRLAKLNKFIETIQKGNFIVSQKAKKGNNILRNAQKITYKGLNLIR